MVVVYRVTQTRRWDSSLGGVAADRDRDLDVRVSLAAPVYYSVNSLKLPSARSVGLLQTPPSSPSENLLVPLYRTPPPGKLATLSVIVAMRHATRW